MSDPTLHPASPLPPAPIAPPHPAGPSVTDDPGFMLGVIGLVAAFSASIVGLVLGIIGLQQSRRAGFQNPPAPAALIVPAGMLAITVVTVLGTVLISMFWLIFVSAIATSSGGYPGY